MHLWSVLHSFHSVNPPSRASAPTIQIDLCNITVRKCSLQFLLHHVVDHILLFEIIAFRGFSGFIGLSCHLSDSSGYSSKPPFWSLSHLMFTVYWGSTRLCPGSTLFSFYMVFFAVLVTPTVINAIYTLWDLTFSVGLSLSSEIHASVSKHQLESIIGKPQSHLKLNIAKLELIVSHLGPPFEPSSFKIPISENGCWDVIPVPTLILASSP